MFVADPVAECTPYFYPPSTGYMKNLPPVWQPAKLLAGDAEGHAKWSAIAGSIPNIPPKVPGVNYDSGADPDCCE
jgi:hypothetical protein